MSIQLIWPNGSHDNCELIVFDKDGTIVDFNSVWLNMAAARAQWLADRLSKNSPELFAWRNRFLRATGVEPETGNISLAGPIVNLSFENQGYCLATLLHTLLPERFPWAEALKFAKESIDWALHQNDPATLATPLEGAFEFIKEVAKTGIKLALITSDSTENAERTLARFEVLDLFSAVRGSDILPAKPSPRALLKVCRQLGIEANKTIVIGDAPNDVRMGKEANIPVLCLEGLANSQQLLEFGAVSTFNHWKDIGFRVKQEKAKSLLLRTDGASRGNPGLAAIGIVILDEEGNRLKRLGKPIGKQTNNFAEYSALICGLEEAIRLNPSKLAIEIDSDLVVKQIQGKYQVKEPTLRNLNLKAKELLAKIKGEWQINYIPRAQNSEADGLCNQALNENREID